MFEELVPAVASALSAKGSELVVAGGTSALRALYDVVRNRFGRGTVEADSLDAALRHPGDTARIAALAESLARVMAQDPAFAQQTRAIWHAVAAKQTADGAAVVNNFSGQAEQVVQARTIRGGVKF